MGFNVVPSNDELLRELTSKRNEVSKRLEKKEEFLKDKFIAKLTEIGCSVNRVIHSDVVPIFDYHGPTMFQRGHTYDVVDLSVDNPITEGLLMENFKGLCTSNYRYLIKTSHSVGLCGCHNEYQFCMHIPEEYEHLLKSDKILLDSLYGLISQLEIENKLVECNKCHTKSAVIDFDRVKKESDGLWYKLTLKKCQFCESIEVIGMELVEEDCDEDCDDYTDWDENIEDEDDDAIDDIDPCDGVCSKCAKGKDGYD